MKIDFEYVMGSKTPMYYKAMMLCQYADGEIFGKLIGKMKEDYQGLRKSDIVFISYRKELFNYQVTVSKFNDDYCKLIPIDYKTFKEVDQLIEFVRSFRGHIHEEQFILENRILGTPEIFKS
jgi:hypothetical protein